MLQHRPAGLRDGVDVRVWRPVICSAEASPAREGVRANGCRGATVPRFVDPMKTPDTAHAASDRDHVFRPLNVATRADRPDPLS